MKKTIKYYCYAFLLLVISVAAGSVETAYAVGGDVVWEYGDTPQTDKQESSAMAVDSAGNVYLTGASDQSGSDDYYTVKVKADGTGIWWSRTFDKTGGDDHAVAIALDSDENIIVTGYVWNGTSYDFHTIKYRSSDGAVLWQHSYNAAMDGNDMATSIAVDSLNNVYVGGYSQGTNGADDFMTVKYSPDGPNPDGTPIWEKSYNGAADGHDRIKSITAGIDGIAVTGESQNGTPDFDALTIKYGFDSSLTWEKRKTVSGNDQGIAVRMDSSGNVIMAATTYNGTNKDIYLVKYDKSTGAELWQDTYDGGYGDEPADLFIDSFDDVYVTGYAYLLSTANDMYTAKYNSAGTFQWSHTYNSSGGNQDTAVQIVVDESGDLFVTGDSYDTSAGNYNFQTVKYNKATGTLLWAKSFDGTANKNDRIAGVGINSSGAVIVAGWTDRWTSGASDYDYYAINYDPGLLNPPTDLTATTFSTTQIDLSWSDNSSNEDGFKIERKVGIFGVWAEIDTVGADVTIYNDDDKGGGLTPETKYYYRVRAYNAADGDSYYSNEANAVTSIMTFTAPSIVYTYGGPDNGDDYVSDLATGPDNNPVVTGYSYSLAGQFDYYTLKLARADLGLDWNARYDSDQNDMDMAITIAVDENNDVLVSGYSFMYAAGGDANTNDIYSIKYPSTGPPEEWNDQYNGPAGDDDRSSVVDISTDGNNNYVVVGYGRNADWNDDIYVLKYSADGTRLWAAVPYDGGVMGHDYPSAVSFDSAGDIVVSGYTYNGTDYDYFVRKYSGVDGTEIWINVYDVAGTGDDFTRGIKIDSLDNIYVTGMAVTGSGNEDFYTIKYDGTNGARLWEKSFNGIADGIDDAIGVAIDLANNDVLVAGTTLVSTGNNDIHIIRYDTAGSVVWERTLDRPDDDDFAVSMSIDMTGNVHVSGDTDDGSPGDIISVQYDYDGNFAGGAIYNGSANDDDRAAAVTVNRLGEAFVGGYEINAASDRDYVVFKVSNNFLQSPAPLTADIHYTRADLYWSDNSLVEDGYHLERKLGTCDSGGSWAAVSGSPFASGTTSYIDDTLNIGSSYCYRVRIFDTESGGTSRWAQKELTTTSPVAPSDLTATTVDTTDIDLAWTDNTTLEDGFVIQRCTGSGSACDEDAEFSDIDTVGSDVTAYTDSSGCESVTYTYRVKAYRTARWATGYSNTDIATTTSLPDPAALNVSAQRITEAETGLSWTAASVDETGYSIEQCVGLPADCTGDINFTEIASLNASDLSAGLLLHMDEASWNGTAGEVVDSSGNDNHGTSYNGANTTAGGPFNNAGNFDGGNDYINIPHSSSINPTGAITVELWAKSDTTNWNNYYFLASKRNAYILGPVISTKEMRFYIYSSGGWRYASYTPSIDITQWHHYTGTFDGTNIRLYIDGTEVAVTPWTGTINSDTGPLTIGRDDGQSRYFNGQIDEVAIYARALSELEIEDHYNNGVSLTKHYYIDTGLDQDQDYTYRMKSQKNATCNWETAYSSLVTAQTTLIAPSDLTATTINTTQIDLAWTDNTATETGFVIERCEGSVCDFTVVDMTDTVGAGVTSYSDTGVCEGRDYRYRVKADRDTAPVWQSTWSDPVASASTPGISGNDPGGLTATMVSESVIDLEWTSNTSDQTGFSIERCTGVMGSAECNDVPSGEFSEISTWEGWSGALLMMAMEEASWTGAADEVTDTSGSGNHGTAYGGVTTIAAGHEGRAGSFDGSNDVVETLLWIDQSSAAVPGVTMEAWVYPTSTSSGRHQVISTDNGGYDWSVLRNGGSWTVFTGSGEFNTGLSVDINQWQHIAAVFKPGTGVTFYKNGYEVKSTATIGYDANDVGIAIGSRAVGGEYFAGRIDDVAVFGTALASTDIENHYELGIQAGSVKRYRDTALIPSTTYTYRVKAYNNASCSWSTGYSNEDDATTDAVPPPSDLALTVINSLTIDLDWTDNTTSETEFKVQRCTGSGTACDEDVEFSDLATVGADVIYYRDDTACEATTYTYRVRAEKTDAAPLWNSGWSVSAEETTIARIAPENLSSRIVSESEIELNWTDNAPDETGFKVARCIGAGCTITLPDDQLPDFVTNDAALMILHMEEALWNNTVDEVRDASGNGYHGRAYGNATTTEYGKFGRGGDFDGSGDYVATSLNLDQSSGSTGVTMEAWVYPYSTSGDWHHVISTDDDLIEWSLTRNGGNWYVYTGAARWNTGISVDVNQWQHIVAVFTPGTGVTFYKNNSSVSTGSIGYNTDDRAVQIGKRARNSSYYFDGRIDEAGIYDRPLTAAEVGQLYAQGAQSLLAKRYTDTGLTPNETYHYRVWTYKDGFCAWESSYLEVNSEVIPPAPENLAAVAVNTTQIDLTWSDKTSDETGFKIERCPGSGTACDEDTEFTEIDTVPTDVKSYSDITACEGQEFSYRVKAYRVAEWESGYSNIDSATTMTKTAPSGLSATRVSEIQIDVAWVDNTDDETGFRIERCDGGSCSFVEIADVGEDVTIFSDMGLVPDTDYTYQVRAYKSASCGWNTAYSNTDTANSTIIEPGNLVATAINTTQIDLSWDINTLSGTGLKIERCEGSGGCSFVEIASVDGDVTTYSDKSLCNSTEYAYRIKGVKEASLSNHGGGCWSRRAPLTITGFERNYATRVDITYDADMKSDFSDIRFYDETAQIELSYWIENKVDNTSATVYLKTLGNNDVNMYYGNAGATSSSDVDKVFEMYEDFAGNTVDTSKWVQIDPDNSISQNDDLLLNDISDSWTKALISKETFRRDDNRELYVSLTTGSNTAGNDYFMVGWEADQSTNPSYNQLVHGFYWNNYNLRTYEKGANTGGTGTYAANTSYEMRVMLNPFGAEYYIKGGAYADWTLVKETNAYSDSPMRVAVTQYSHQATIHLMKVHKYLSVEPSVVVGAEEQDTCYMFTNTWSTAYSNEATATTISHAAPSGLTAVTSGDSAADLTWGDNTIDETGFKVERCVDSGCSDFVQIDTVSNSSLVMLLQMNEASWNGTANEAADGSGNDNDGTAYNGADTAAGGKYGRGGIFDGTDDYVEVQHSSSINPTGAITVELWAKSDTTNWNDSGMLISKRNAYIMYPVSGTKTMRFYIYDGGWHYATYVPGMSFDLTQWHHYVGTYDGSNIRVYVDGLQVADVAYTGSIGSDSGPLRIGWDDEISSSYFDGMMDEVAIYDIALSGAEVQAHFADGVEINTTYSDTGLDPGTTYCYRVRAYKTATCGWDSGYSNESCDRSFSGRPTNLIATALNSLVVKLDWTDNSNDEDGYEVEKQLADGSFVLIKTTGPDIVTFTDTMGINPEQEYTYRIKAFKGSESSPYSNEASVTMPVWQAGDDTCY